MIVELTADRVTVRDADDRIRLSVATDLADGDPDAAPPSAIDPAGSARQRRCGLRPAALTRGGPHHILARTGICIRILRWFAHGDAQTCQADAERPDGSVICRDTTGRSPACSGRRQ